MYLLKSSAQKMLFISSTLKGTPTKLILQVYSNLGIIILL